MSMSQHVDLVLDIGEAKVCERNQDPENYEPMSQKDMILELKIMPPAVSSNWGDEDLEAGGLQGHWRS